MIIDNTFKGKALSFDSVPAPVQPVLKAVNPSSLLIRKNKGITHSKEDVLIELNNRFNNTFNSSVEPLGKKNLVFFTLDYNIDYIHLFLYCLRSIVNKDNSDAFDLLVICPVRFESLINEYIDAQCIDLKGFNLMFHHVDESNDGVDASMNKLKIYQFEGIDVYGKVLFLDSDIIAKEPISELFNLELDANKIHSAIYKPHDYLHNNKYHSLVEYDLVKMNEFRDKGIYAFNAGQYLFVNSARMLHHMYNVDWLTRAWPAEYFFEQSFLNHYFNWFCISDVYLLEGYVKFMAIHLWDKADIASEYKLSYSVIHFTGHACDASKKIDFIRHFHPDLIK